MLPSISHSGYSDSMPNLPFEVFRTFTTISMYVCAHRPSYTCAVPRLELVSTPTELLHYSSMNIGLSDHITHPKRKFLSNRNEKVVDQSKFDNPIESTKKKSKASTQVQKRGKKKQSKRAQKNMKSGDEEECNAAVNGQISSSCYSSDNESNNSQEMNGGGSTSSSSKGSPALNMNAKTRAGRAGQQQSLAQSLYARKRR